MIPVDKKKTKKGKKIKKKEKIETGWKQAKNSKAKKKQTITCDEINEIHLKNWEEHETGNKTEQS